MKRIVALTAVVCVLYVGKTLLAVDWASILPPVGKAGLVEDKPMSPREALGADLFFDTALSANGKVSCSSCHDPERGYASHGRPKGLDGQFLGRKAPSLINRGLSASLFVDGRATSLESQIDGPLFSPKEMGNTKWDDILARLAKYEPRFKGIYKDGLNRRTVAISIAEFERTIDHKSPLDEYLSGKNDQALTEAEARGYDLFRGKANCYKCHPVDPERSHTLTDGRYHNTGLPSNDWGRYEVTRKEEDRYKFRTPSIRGCSLYPPYMHDGSLRTLEDVVEFYDKGGEPKQNRDREMFPLRLSPEEKKDLVAFLKVI